MVRSSLRLLECNVSRRLLSAPIILSFKILCSQIIQKYYCVSKSNWTSFVKKQFWPNFRYNVSNIFLLLISEQFSAEPVHFMSERLILFLKNASQKFLSFLLQFFLLSSIGGIDFAKLSRII